MKKLIKIQKYLKDLDVNFEYSDTYERIIFTVSKDSLYAKKGDKIYIYFDLVISIKKLSDEFAKYYGQCFITQKELIMHLYQFIKINV